MQVGHLVVMLALAGGYQVVNIAKQGGLLNQLIKLHAKEWIWLRLLLFVLEWLPHLLRCYYPDSRLFSPLIRCALLRGGGKIQKLKVMMRLKELTFYYDASLSQI